MSKFLIFTQDFFFIIIIIVLIISFSIRYPRVTVKVGHLPTINVGRLFIRRRVKHNNIEFIMILISK